MTRPTRSTRSTPGALAGTPGHGGSASHDVQEYWWYLARADMLHSALGSYAVGARTALDIGSADGPSAGWIREAIPHVASLDIDPRNLGATGVCGSALALPFPDEAFDLVSAFDVIEHCAPEDAALAEVRRVIRPGGTFLMAVPAYQWAWTDFDVANGHHRRYTRGRAVAALERAGFVVQRSTYAFTSVFPLFAAERLARRLRGSRLTEAVQTVSVPRVSRPVHHALMALCRVDDGLLRRVDLPFGSSVFLAATRPE